LKLEERHTVTTIRKSAAAAAVLIAAMSASASGAWSATLDKYYRTSMVIRACDLNVDRRQATGLSRAIELQVMQLGLSDEDIAAVTDPLNRERLADEPAFCVNSQPVVDEVLAEF
jgi:hypothetical protein